MNDAEPVDANPESSPEPLEPRAARGKLEQILPWAIGLAVIVIGLAWTLRLSTRARSMKAFAPLLAEAWPLASKTPTPGKIGPGELGKVLPLAPDRKIVDPIYWYVPLPMRPKTSEDVLSLLFLEWGTSGYSRTCTARLVRRSDGALLGTRTFKAIPSEEDAVWGGAITQQLVKWLEEVAKDGN